MTEYQEAKKETNRTEEARKSGLEQELLKSGLPKGFGMQCLSAHELLLLKVSQAERRREKGLRLQLQHKCPG